MATRAAIDVGKYLAGVRLNESQKAKVFISSRMSCELQGERLSAIRDQLKSLLEAAFPFVQVHLAERWTAGQKGSARELSVAGARLSDMTIGIFVDSAGHRDEAGLFATELELVTALEDSWDKVVLFAHKSLQANLAAQPKDYRDLLERVMAYKNGKNVALFETKDELFQSVVAAVAGHAASAIRRYPSRTSGKSDEQARWELKTFTERHGAIHEAFKEVAANVRDVGKVLSLGFDSAKLDHATYAMELSSEGRKPVVLPVIVSVCPDRYALADAARFVGYPFRTMTEGWKNPLGPLHITCIYRTMTDTQIRKHLGNPDIRVAKEPWGYFARDPERSIQGLYLTKCEDETMLRTRLYEALEWLTSQVLDEVMVAAKARGRILAAMG